MRPFILIIISQFWMPLNIRFTLRNIIGRLLKWIIFWFLQFTYSLVWYVLFNWLLNLNNRITIYLIRIIYWTSILRNIKDCIFKWCFMNLWRWVETCIRWFNTILSFQKHSRCSYFFFCYIRFIYIILNLYLVYTFCLFYLMTIFLKNVFSNSTITELIDRRLKWYHNGIYILTLQILISRSVILSCLLSILFFINFRLFNFLTIINHIISGKKLRFQYSNFLHLLL